MKIFRLFWEDGTTEIVKGKDIRDAIKNVKDLFGLSFDDLSPFIISWEEIYN